MVAAPGCVAGESSPYEKGISVVKREGIERHCTLSGRPFVISPEAQAFYQRLNIPSPKLCPDERARCRLAWRNERTLYRRACSATGKQIVSIFDQSVSFPVFQQSHWWSDAWEALSYGREFDFSRPFFEQFAELFSVVPQCALRAPQSENCEYTNQCEKNKDCYLVFCSNGSRECLYGMWFQSCTDCLDCLYLEQSELCYELLNCKNCYRCTSSDNLLNCSECHFSRDLIGCRNCIGCANLRNREYCFMNEQLSAEEWKQRVAALALGSHTARQSARIQFESFLKQFPRKHYAGRNNERCSGDYLENNRNAIECFNCRNSEQLQFCRDAWSGRNSMDLTETLEQDFCVELEGCYANNDCGFSAKISETDSVWYSSHCFNCSDAFGCVGLRGKRNCIFNVCYGKDEYHRLRARIVDHMKQTGEWGSYFPIRYSPFAYNETVAQEYFPLSQAEVEQQGWRWKNESSVTRHDAPQASPPDHISAAGDEILQQTYACSSSGREFKVQRAELKFYRKMDLPLPRQHHDVRHAARMNRRNPRILWKRGCDRCDRELQSTFSPDRLETVLCEPCYLQVI